MSIEEYVNINVPPPIDWYRLVSVNDIVDSISWAFEKALEEADLDSDSMPIEPLTTPRPPTPEISQD